LKIKFTSFFFQCKTENKIVDGGGIMRRWQCEVSCWYYSFGQHCEDNHYFALPKETPPYKHELPCNPQTRW